MSLFSDPFDACPFVLSEFVYVETSTSGFITIGDRVFYDPSGSNPFMGDGNYWHLQLDSSGFAVSAEVDSSGYVGGSISIC